MRVRRFAGSLLHGSLSDVGCLSVPSWRRPEGNRHREIQWAGTRSEPSPARPRWAVLTGRDAGLCCFVPGWRPSGYSSPSFPPALFLAECQSKAVAQPVQQQCAQVLAALTWTVESPESPNTWAVLLGQAHLNPSTLALVVSGLAEQVSYLAFQPLENFYPSVLWDHSEEARQASHAAVIWRVLWSYAICHCLIMLVSSTPQLGQSTLKLVFLPQKHQNRLCSLFLDIIFKYHLPTEIFSLASQKATLLLWPIPLVCDFKRTEDGP